MIDYSVYLQPNPMDETAAPKAYAKAQMHELMTFEKFIDHIAKHNGVFTRGTVRGVVVDMCECLVEMLLEGKKVLLGELGSFWVSLTSEGAESMEKFTVYKVQPIEGWNSRCYRLTAFKEMQACLNELLYKQIKCLINYMNFQIWNRNYKLLQYYYVYFII